MVKTVEKLTRRFGWLNFCFSQVGIKFVSLTSSQSNKAHLVRDKLEFKQCTAVLFHLITKTVSDTPPFWPFVSFYILNWSFVGVCGEKSSMGAQDTRWWISSKEFVSIRIEKTIAATRSPTYSLLWQDCGFWMHEQPRFSRQLQSYVQYKS